jgi:glycosyltransferase involved in cell wall biosynthesis
MLKPEISIITIVYNDVEKIEATIKSVLSQCYSNLNYIIIDGDSNDGTVDIIKKYEEQLTYWSSCKDKGISDAFNRGIHEAQGYILMLNSGDTFVNERSLEEVSVALTQPLVIFEVLNSLGKRVGINSLSDDLQYLAHLPHQGTFVHKEIYKDIGLYSLGFKIRMDYEFFSRVVQKYRPLFVNKVLVNFDSTGVSSSLKYRIQFEIEGILIEYLYFGKSLLSLVYRPWVRFLGSYVKGVCR